MSSSDSAPRFVSSRQLLTNCLFLAVVLTASIATWGDSWALPSDQDYSSANGEYRFSVNVGAFLRPGNAAKRCRGVLKQRVDSEWQTVWEKPLSSRISPVNAIVHNKGQFVVTFDEWHGIGTNPVIIYDEHGDLVAKLQLTDLGIPDDHSLIDRSVSSYHWNSHAIYLFGPPPKADAPDWRKQFADTLFIRLHWGELITIDLPTGTLRTDEGAKGRAREDAQKLKQATNEFLEESYRELAQNWLVEENFFDSDPNSDGIRGILLAKELKLKQYLPLLRKVAQTDRFEFWAAPDWPEADREINLQSFAQHVVKSIESP